MYRITLFIIFFAVIAYLFYSPAPMDKIGKTVKTRDCYHLRLMDQERLSLAPEKTNTTAKKNATATLDKESKLQKITSIEDQTIDNFSLAMGEQSQ